MPAAAALGVSTQSVRASTEKRPVPLMLVVAVVAAATPFTVRAPPVGAVESRIAV